MNTLFFRIVAAGALGALTAFLVSVAVGWSEIRTETLGLSSNTDNEVHVHADFMMYINGEQIDFSADKYQSVEGDVRHLTTHLHNNNGHVVHRHADGITFADLLDSLGFTLTKDCLTSDESISYCTDAKNELRLYVNDEVHSNPTEYIVAEEDRILVYYGAPNTTEIKTYLEEVPDDACIASGTCPERGVPQPETCGATCEI